MDQGEIAAREQLLEDWPGITHFSTLMMSTEGWSSCFVDDILDQSRSCTVSLKGRAFTSTGQVSAGNHEKTRLCSWNRLQK